jgi:hypothetical protein
LIFVPPPATQVEEPMLLAVTFRPVVRRPAGATAGLAKAA